MVIACLWDDFKPKVITPFKLKSVKNYLAVNGFRKTVSKIFYSLVKKKSENHISHSELWKKDMNKCVAGVMHKIFIAKKSECKKIFHDKNF